MYHEGMLRSTIEKFFGSTEGFEGFDEGQSLTIDPTDREQAIIDGITKEIRNTIPEVLRNLPSGPIPANQEVLPESGMEGPEPPFKPQESIGKEPTKDNPFGNSLPFDTIDRQIYKVSINEEKKDDKYHEGLFNNVDDLFGKRNGELSFTSNASTTKLNDQEAAIQYFYNTPYTEEER
jgi:hypothetical protein